MTLVRRGWWPWLLAAAAGLPAACVSDAAPDPCGQQPVRAALVGGAPRAAEPATDGIGYLRVTIPDQLGRIQRLCTVSRTRPGKVVTARHCIGDAAGWRAWVGFGPEARSVPDACDVPDELRPVEGHHFHPELDVAVLDFVEASPSQPTLPVADRVPTVGAPVTLAGYGLTEQGRMGEKRFAASTVSRVDPPLVTVQSAVADGATGACVGDSGGPLLVGDSGGGYQVAGFLSRGSADCRGSDLYVSGVAAWLQSVGAL